MGVHTGRVRRDQANLHGRTVVVAARIVARACGGEIFVSEAVASWQSAPGRVRFARVGDVTLEGLNRREKLYSVPVSSRRPALCRACRIQAGSATRPGHRQRAGSSARRLHTDGRSRFDLEADDARSDTP
jgi:hypothetical protein